MRFHANLNLPWKKYSREEGKSAWWSAKRLMQTIKPNVSSVSLVISTYLLIRFLEKMNPCQRAYQKRGLTKFDLFWIGQSGLVLLPVVITHLLGRWPVVVWRGDLLDTNNRGKEKPPDHKTHGSLGTRVQFLARQLHLHCVCACHAQWAFSHPLQTAVALAEPTSVIPHPHILCMVHISSPPTYPDPGIHRSGSPGPTRAQRSHWTAKKEMTCWNGARPESDKAGSTGIWCEVTSLGGSLVRVNLLCRPSNIRSPPTLASYRPSGSFISL